MKTRHSLILWRRISLRMYGLKFLMLRARLQLRYTPLNNFTYNLFNGGSRMTESSKDAPKMTPQGAVKGVISDLLKQTREEAKLVNIVASWEQKLATTPNDTVVNKAYHLRIMRLRAKDVKALGSVRKKISKLNQRIEKYNANIEVVLKSRNLYWGV